jgi:predicted DNA-binding protein YlxM (UPF0122 family)
MTAPNLLLSTNKKWLETRYIDKKLSTREIAKEAQVAQCTVMYWLKKYKIPTRTCSESLKGRKLPPESIKKREKTKRQNGIRISEITLKKAREVNTGRPMPSNVKDALLRANIGRCGERAGHWQGGKSFEPYCPKFNEKLKEEIRENFNRKCLLCGIGENGRRHAVHHVDYNKGQGCGQKWSLVPLCHKCHIKTNTNRWYWFNLLNGYWISVYPEAMVAVEVAQ